MHAVATNQTVKRRVRCSMWVEDFALDVPLSWRRLLSDGTLIVQSLLMMSDSALYFPPLQLEQQEHQYRGTQSRDAPVSGTTDPCCHLDRCFNSFGGFSISLERENFGTWIPLWFQATISLWSWCSVWCNHPFYSSSWRLSLFWQLIPPWLSWLCYWSGW